MDKRKFKITLFNENQYFKKTYVGIPVKYTTACNIYNTTTKPPFNQNAHDFKCYDSFSIKNERVRLVIFYGNEIKKVVYADGTVREDIIGKYELMRSVI